MSNARPPIPAALERALMIEAAYRCAVCKTAEPLQIDHIEEWSIVQKHEAHNMIVLCANCHARKKNTSDPRHINRASLKQIKASLVAGRDPALEPRIIEASGEELKAKENEPIVWDDNLGIEYATLTNGTVYMKTFIVNGANKTDREIALSDAYFISGKTGETSIFDK